MMAHEAPSRSVDHDLGPERLESPLVPRGDTKGWRGPNADVMEPAHSEGGMIELSFQHLSLPGSPRIMLQAVPGRVAPDQALIPNTSARQMPDQAVDSRQQTDSASHEQADEVDAGHALDHHVSPSGSAARSPDPTHIAPSTDAFRAAVDAAMGRRAESVSSVDGMFSADLLRPSGPTMDVLPRSLPIDPQFDASDRAMEPFAPGDYFPPSFHQDAEGAKRWQLEGESTDDPVPPTDSQASPSAAETNDGLGRVGQHLPSDPEVTSDIPTEEIDDTDQMATTAQAPAVGSRESEGGMVPLFARHDMPNGPVATSSGSGRPLNGVERVAAQTVDAYFEQSNQPAQISANLALFRGVTLASLSANHAHGYVHEEAATTRLGDSHGTDVPVPEGSDTIGDVGMRPRPGWTAALMVPAIIAGQWWRRRRHHGLDSEKSLQSSARPSRS